MAPICARNAAARSCCCAAWRVAARANPGGNSPSTSAPAPIAAIICNHSRRVLLVTLPLTVHLALEVRCNMSRVHSRARVRLRQDQPLVFELDVRLSENVRERDQRYRHDAAPLPRVWHSRCGDALSFCRRLWTRRFRDSGPQHAATNREARSCTTRSATKEPASHFSSGLRCWLWLARNPRVPGTPLSEPPAFPCRGRTPSAVRERSARAARRPAAIGRTSTSA